MAQRRPATREERDRAQEKRASTVPYPQVQDDVAVSRAREVPLPEGADALTASPYRGGRKPWVPNYAADPRSGYRDGLPRGAGLLAPAMARHRPMHYPLCIRLAPVHRHPAREMLREPEGTPNRGRDGVGGINLPVRPARPLVGPLSRLAH